ncbi:MAG: hypothetical protein HY293_13715 [Planctomycetes bacterium]|nr:hypothetical protein [Planctomycetota bacterium]
MQLLILTAALCAGAFQEPAAPQGPAAYYKLDEANTAGTAADSVAGGVAGAYVGPPTVSTAVNTVNTYPNPRCLSFSGSGQCVNIGNFGSFTNFTVSTWVNRSATAGGRQSIVSYKEGNGVNMGFVLCLNESGTTEYPRIWVMVNGAWLNAEQAVAVPQGAWTHLAASYDGANITLYVNGLQAAQTAAPGAMTNSGVQNCVIGARADYTSNFFPGLIDDVRIYSRALLATEVAVLAAGCPVPTNLTASSTAVGQIDLAWAAPGGPAVTYTYHIRRKPTSSPASSYVTIATQAGLTYTDTVYPYYSYDYEITAVSAAESGPSASVSIVPMMPPPRTQKVGNDRDPCGCGSALSPGWASLAALALALALVLTSFKR